MFKKKKTSVHATCTRVDPENENGLSVSGFINDVHLENIPVEHDSELPYCGCDLVVTIHPDGDKTARFVLEEKISWDALYANASPAVATD
jgi:hypothetical protein